MKNTPLLLALNEFNKPVSIFEVPTGVNCKCICPNPLCNKPLCAKNNDKSPNTVLKKGQKAAHFAHLDESTICPSANESALHALAKEVLSNEKCLLLPPIEYDDQILKGAVRVLFDEVIEESRKYFQHKIQPDCIGFYSSNQELFVEFFKSHAVDDDKKTRLRRLKIPCIEIDVNSIEPILEGQINYRGMKSFLETQYSNRNWIHTDLKENLIKEYEENKAEHLKTFLKAEEKDNALWKTTEGRLSEVLSKLEKQGFELIKIKKEKSLDVTENVYGHNILTERESKSMVKCPKSKTIIETHKCEGVCSYSRLVTDEVVACGFRNKLER